jgi:DNA polymerase-1
VGALEGVRLHLVDSMAELDACRSWVGERRETPLGVDTESGGLNPHKDAHRLTQLGDKRHGWAFPPEWAGAANEMVRGYDRGLVMHNRPYDWRVLAVHHGMEPRWAQTDDTLLNGHIADSLRLAGLKERATQEVDPSAMAGEMVLSEGMARQHWTWATVPATWKPYWMYGALDPVLTCHLWDKETFSSARRDYRAAYDLEQATARICANMMMTGMLVDVPFVREKITEITAYTEHAAKWLRREYGIFNVNSGDQVINAMNRAGIPTLVYTDKGNPSLDKDALKLYRTMFPQHAHLIDAISWCRKGEALVNRYLQKFLDMRDIDDIVHYSIWSCKARTTRMSVTEPAMQTFDRDVPVVRGSFIPRPGWVFISIDADQIEGRFAAHFSGDPHMIAEFRRCDELGLKFFVEMASKIYSERISKSDPRYTFTKNATYGQIYGASLDKAAATAGVPVETMRPAYMGFRQLYPEVGRLMERMIREARGGRPVTTTLTGRKLYTFRGKEYALLNTKIQGSAAEFMKQGLIDLDAAGFGPYLRLPVHDEILMEVPKEYAEEALRVATDILTDRTNFRVPITWAGSILPDRWRKT